MTSLILVVEDDPVTQRLLKSVLEREGYEVLTADNGGSALRLISRRPPDLIVLDMHLPGMTGWEFLERYQTLPDPRAPVIGTSADADAGSANVVSFLRKPFELPDLFTLIKQYLAS